MYYELSILAYLITGDRYGYEIKKYQSSLFAYSGSIQNSTLYPVLRKLTTAGYTMRMVSPAEHGADRVVYTITPAGREYFVTELRLFPDNMTQKREFVVRLLYFSWMDRTSRVRLLNNYEKLLSKADTLTMPDILDSVPASHVLSFLKRDAENERKLIDEFRSLLDMPCTMDDHGNLL